MLRSSWQPRYQVQNISAIALASNPIYHARTKHIEVDYHFIRAKVLRGDIQVYFVSFIDQLVAIFIKWLGSSQFQLLNDKLHVNDSLFRL